MKILLGMSGGLDSTYAAYLLRQQGHTVEGAVLKMHPYSEVEDARIAAENVGIPLHIIDCSAAFEESVVAPFIRSYLHGQTPNPCIFCNPAVKFEFLLRYALSHGFDRIATGHYCRIGQVGDRYAVFMPDDTEKDQSYVLWGLSQEQLSHLITPLSSLRKEDIRAQALRLGFAAAHKKDSQEICFIPSHDYASFLESRCGKMPEGDFVDWNGRVVGRHRGILHYTVGQRRGLGIALGVPVFVSRIDATANTVHLAQAGGEYSTCASISSLSFQALPPQPSGTELDTFVRVRYSAPLMPVHVRFTDTGALLEFPSPVRAVTPGQSAVFYSGGAVQFGGFID